MTIASRLLRVLIIANILLIPGIMSTKKKGQQQEWVRGKFLLMTPAMRVLILANELL